MGVTNILDGYMSVNLKLARNGLSLSPSFKDSESNTSAYKKNTC